jgi:manganese transport protein
LPFAVVPLVKFTSSRLKMRTFASPIVVSVLAWVVATVIIALNAKLVFDKTGEWHESAGAHGWIVLALMIPLSLSLLALLLWMMFRREHAPEAPVVASADAVASAAQSKARVIRRVGVALEAEDTDTAMLTEAIGVATLHKAELVLMHVVEGVGGQYHGARADDVERRHDERYMAELVERLKRDLDGSVPAVVAVLGYGDVRRELIRLAREQGLDMLVVGGHGHRGVGDILRGTTIDGVRHNLSIPLLAVRAPASPPQHT